jgi:hypothetical protein
MAICVEEGIIVAKVGAADEGISLTFRYLFLGSSAWADWKGETVVVVVGMMEIVEGGSNSYVDVASKYKMLLQALNFLQNN